MTAAIANENICSSDSSNVTNWQDECTITRDSFKRVSYFRLQDGPNESDSMRLNEIDGNLCTHLILAWARINANGELIVMRESDLVHLNDVKELKRKYAHLKVLISVRNDEEFNGFPRLTASLANTMLEHHQQQSPPSSSQELRSRFAKSAMDFLGRFHLDGLDLDWEYPNFPTNLLSSREHERIGLTKILTSLRSAIVENFFARQAMQQHQQQQVLPNYHHHQSSGLIGESMASSVEPYLLTVALAGQEAILRSSYELRPVANLCDWLNVMSYDYFLFKPYAPFTGPSAPLYSIVDPYVPILSKMSLAWTTSKLVHEETLPRDKLVMGISTYARGYRLLFRQTQPTPFTLAVGARQAGLDSPNDSLIDKNASNNSNHIAGHSVHEYLDYNQVLELLSHKDSVVDFDERAQVPYLLTENGYTWISYENVRSVRSKVQFIMRQNLGGYMTWSLNSDERRTIKDQRDCSQDVKSSQGEFTLHRAMLDEMQTFFENVKR